jgi:hypothetical protein
MVTMHVDCSTPTITHSGSFTTIRFDRGLAIQLDLDEWVALVDAVAATMDFNSVHAQERAIVRNENAVRSDAAIREALQ